MQFDKPDRSARAKVRMYTASCSADSLSDGRKGQKNLPSSVSVYTAEVTAVVGEA
jgi:hypothetical protein